MERASTVTVDTLAIFQRLKNAGLQEEAAREIAMVIKDVFENNMLIRTSFDSVPSDLETGT